MKRPVGHLVAVAVAMVMLAAAGITSAAASNLRLDAKGTAQAVVHASRCGSGSATVSLAASSVAVSGIDATCNGKKLQVWVRNGSSTWRVSGTVSGSTLVLAPGGAVDSVQWVAVTIDTWAIPSTWSVKSVDLPMIGCTLVGNPKATCSVRFRILTSWPTPPTYYQAYVDVLTDSPDPVVWQLTYNLSSPDWPFFAKSLKNNQPGGLVLISKSSCSASPRTVTVQGYAGWSKDKIWAGHSADVDVQGSTSAGGDLLSC